MAKRFAVGYISFFSNKLIIEVIEADDWKSALLKHSTIVIDKQEKKFLETAKNLEEVKEFAFNGDSMVAVVEIPEAV